MVKKRETLPGPEQQRTLRWRQARVVVVVRFGLLGFAAMDLAGLVALQSERIEVRFEQLHAIVRNRPVGWDASDPIQHYL